ncbi:MAG TPA: hypothetical protein DEQ38_04700 [Elusimicrobia bacterium]|nr:MAG: hypothetical protein A2089_00665 [Elusimicrobia bacterium GWD2_63_28]HCC47401.1 hypothetical protein [Elusimicrobiota bacterium]
MKNILLTVSMLSLLAAACAGAQAKGKAAQFKNFAMENNYFSCSVPAAWSMERDQEKDEEYKIYEIQLLAPVSGKAPTSVFVSYYAKDNADFNGYQDYVNSNSKNVLGETKSARENYEPVKDITLAGRKALLLSRERMVFLHPTTKSDESVQLKEKLYVLPAKAGFYVLHFSAPKDSFLANLGTFEKIAKSFKGLP